MTLRVAVIFGTRPEAIKMAPVVAALQAQSDFEPIVCVSAQHRQMLDQVLDLFGVQADYDLDLMEPNQTPASFTSRALQNLHALLEAVKPDIALVHGDTTTALAGALAAFYARVPIGHVEAGLRSHDFSQPWPEEMNRCVVDRIADQHYAPTEAARQNLLKEGVRPDRIAVTGNTGIDALLLMREKLRRSPEHLAAIDKRFPFLDRSKHLVLVTGHRRESFGAGFENICQALLRVAHNPNVQILYPVHLNPNVQDPVRRLLSQTDNIFLTEPVDYLTFVGLMEAARLILTDSGGIQEEAPALGRPVLVMREVSERPEAIAAGGAILVGTDPDRIAGMIDTLLRDADVYARASVPRFPYGDGTAARQIAERIANVFRV